MQNKRGEREFETFRVLVNSIPMEITKNSSYSNYFFNSVVFRFENSSYFNYFLILLCLNLKINQVLRMLRIFVSQTVSKVSIY